MMQAVAPQFKLRDYQRQVVQTSYQAVREGNLRLLVVMIMGAGKTITASWMMRDAVSRRKRCLFLVALNVLLDQTANTLEQMGVDCTVLQGDRPQTAAPIIVASLQTIAARLRQGKTLSEILGPIDLILIDEAHETAFHSTYSEIETGYPDAIRIGLTATPWRLSKREWLRQKFDCLIEGPQPPEIIKLGGAVPCRGFTIGGALDLEKLHVRGGDYVDSEMSMQACRPEALEHVVNEWKRLCKDRPTLAIGSTIVQAQKTCETFNQHGISAEVLIGSTPKDERKRMFDRVRSGQTLILCSVGALRAGFDLPCISAILYVRATKSKALFYQSSGRGSRPAPGKSDYLLLDFGGNLKRFGDPMGYQDYCIDEQPGSDHQAPTKTCSECGAEILAFAQICPECGSQFAGEKDAEAEKSDRLVQLSEWADQFARAKIAKLRQWRRQTFLAGESPDLAVARFVSEFGHTPPPNWMQNACLTRRYSQKRQEAYCNWIFSQCKTNNRWAEQWIRYHLAAEFGIDDRDSLDSWHDVLECYTANWAEVLAAYRSRLRLCSNEGEAAELAEALQSAMEDLAIEPVVGMEVAL